MRWLVFLLMGVGFSSAHANTNHYAYLSQSGKAGSLSIYDKPNSYGEEKATWTHFDGITYESNLLSGNSSNWDIQIDGGDSGRSYNLTVLLNKRYQELHSELTDEEWAELIGADRCEDRHVGLLLVFDNKKYTQEAYCLDLANPVPR